MVILREVLGAFQTPVDLAFIQRKRQYTAVIDTMNDLNGGVIEYLTSHTVVIVLGQLYGKHDCAQISLGR